MKKLKNNWKREIDESEKYFFKKKYERECDGWNMGLMWDKLGTNLGYTLFDKWMYIDILKIIF